MHNIQKTLTTVLLLFVLLASTALSVTATTATGPTTQTTLESSDNTTKVRYPYEFVLEYSSRDKIWQIDSLEPISLG